MNMAKAKQPVSINGIEFDALIGENRTLEAESPDYPVEDGFDVNDSIILHAGSLAMTLFVTNMPVTWKQQHGGQTDRVENVVKQLEELFLSRTLCTIVTTDKTYQDMAILNVTLTKSKEVGYAREIPITFKEIRKTTAKTVTIPDSYLKSGLSGANAGTASTTQVSGGSAGSSNSSSGESKAATILGGFINYAGDKVNNILGG
jgi:hypothetical protein